MIMGNFQGKPKSLAPHRPSRGPRRPYHEGKDVGGVGSLVSFWTWPVLSGCLCVGVCAR